jgi:hypothetical protein
MTGRCRRRAGKGPGRAGKGPSMRERCPDTFGQGRALLGPVLRSGVVRGLAAPPRKGSGENSPVGFSGCRKLFVFV